MFQVSSPASIRRRALRFHAEDSEDREVAEKEAKARNHTLDWYRYTNEDSFLMQAAVFLGILAAGACVTALLLWPRRLLGLSFPVLLGLLAFPLFFVLVATGIYWAVEGPGVGRKERKWLKPARPGARPSAPTLQ